MPQTLTFRNIDNTRSYDILSASRGAVAQLGERMTGSHEAEGSIPFSSTNTKLSQFLLDYLLDYP
jgi:hypothetical protein